MEFNLEEIRRMRIRALSLPRIRKRDSHPIENDNLVEHYKRLKLKKEKNGSSDRAPILVEDSDEEELQRQKHIKNEITKRDHKEDMTSTEVLQKADSESGLIAFADGVVKLTAVNGHKKLAYHISFEDVICKDELELAVLAAFCIDEQWLLPKLAVGVTDIYLVYQAKNDIAKKQITSTLSSVPGVFPIFPDMSSSFCMHSKLMLLFYPKFLRVCVPSANLLDIDWGETGELENILYIQDFPKIKDEETCDKYVTDFSRSLFMFSEKCGYPTEVLAKLVNYDYRKSNDVRFVYSVGNWTRGEEQIYSTGYPGLFTALRELKFDAQNVKVDYITSSVGNLRKSFLALLWSAIIGEQRYLDSGKQISKEEDKLFDQVRRSMKIWFPSREDVLKSTAGGMGSICFQRKYWEAKSFPRDIMYKLRSKRAGCLMHSKLILMRLYDEEDRLSGGFAYVGSANISQSAWGSRIITDGKLGTRRIHIRNWECGVVVPYSLVSQALPMILESPERNTDPYFFND